MSDSFIRWLHHRLQERTGAGLDEMEAFRLVDRDCPGLPGVTVDIFASRWLFSGPGGPALSGALVEACLAWGARAVYWKCLAQTADSAPEWIAGERVDGRFVAHEDKMKFYADFSSGYSQGIFPDQKENRRRLAHLTVGGSVLNTFAYTGLFGLRAMLGGAVSCVHLDLSRRCLGWAIENYALNGLAGNPRDFVFGDAFDWLGRFGRRKRTFDWIILDPPTFSRDRQGGIFCVERDLGKLVELALGCLSRNGGLFVSCNHHGMSGQDFHGILRQALGPGWKVSPGFPPAEFTGPEVLKSAFCIRG